MKDWVLFKNRMIILQEYYIRKPDKFKNPKDFLQDLNSSSIPNNQLMS